MDDYLSAELERLLPDYEDYRPNIGVEIGEVGFSKPLWHLAWQSAW